MMWSSRRWQLNDNLMEVMESATGMSVDDNFPEGEKSHCKGPETSVLEQQGGTVASAEYGLGQTGAGSGAAELECCAKAFAFYSE